MQKQFIIYKFIRVIKRILLTWYGFVDKKRFREIVFIYFHYFLFQAFLPFSIWHNSVQLDILKL